MFFKLQNVMYGGVLFQKISSFRLSAISFYVVRNFSRNITSIIFQFTFEKTLPTSQCPIYPGDSAKNGN